MPFVVKREVQAQGQWDNGKASEVLPEVKPITFLLPLSLQVSSHLNLDVRALNCYKTI